MVRPSCEGGVTMAKDKKEKKLPKQKPDELKKNEENKRE